MALRRRETWSSSTAMERRGSSRCRRGEEGRVATRECEDAAAAAADILTGGEIGVEIIKL
jgi:hypothetical protein